MLFTTGGNMKTRQFMYAALVFACITNAAVAAGQDKPIAEILGETITLANIEPPASINTIKNTKNRKASIERYQRDRLAGLIIQKIQADQLHKLGKAPTSIELQKASDKLNLAQGGTKTEYDKMIAEMKKKLAQAKTDKQRKAFGDMIQILLKSKQEQERSSEKHDELVLMMANNMVSSWKFNNELYHKGKGKVAYGKCGLLAIDAIKALADKYTASNQLMFFDKKYSRVVAEYLDSLVLESGNKPITRNYAAKYFKNPWWDNPNTELMGPEHLTPVIM